MIKNKKTLIENLTKKPKQKYPTKIGNLIKPNWKKTLMKNNDKNSNRNSNKDPKQKSLTKITIKNPNQNIIEV